MLINGVEIQKRGHILEIGFEDKVLNEKVRADFQDCDSQYIARYSRLLNH